MLLITSFCRSAKSAGYSLVIVENRRLSGPGSVPRRRREGLFRHARGEPLEGEPLRRRGEWGGRPGIGKLLQKDRREEHHTAELRVLYKTRFKSCELMLKTVTEHHVAGLHTIHNRQHENY